MKIPCFRCGKEIDTPNDKNADYITALDTIAIEDRDVLICLKHNQATKVKLAKMQEADVTIREDGEVLRTPIYPNLKIDESEYDEVEINNIAEGKQFGNDFIRVKAEIRPKSIQKTGIICPDDYKVTDFVIWGVHKKK